MNPITSPLRVCPENHRYFADADGRAVYLTGSHVWHSLQDLGRTDPPPAFDYDAYLDLMASRNHNFMRMWRWELARYTYDGEDTFAAPHPWVRSGPGNALDGRPKFDLARHDEAYFQRLRSRVETAGRRGIYVSIMLFEGHGLHASLEPWCRDGHPFCRHNNVNGIDGDPADTGRVLDTHTLEHPEITAIQEAYVRRVVDAVGDLDNVLYEISNETGAYSTAWQYHLIDYIHDLEADRARQHPVGMTFQFCSPDTGNNQALFDGPADWISPNPEGGYREDPPAADGSKVILTDTDHLWGLGCATGWVWKSFTRGLNPLLMDPVAPFPGIDAHPQWGDINRGDHPLWDPNRVCMGDTARYARRLDLNNTVPRPDLATTGYCLAHPGVAYLAYGPDGGDIGLDLTEASGSFRLEWFSVPRGEIVGTGEATGGSKQTFAPPCEGEVVLYIWR